MKVPLIALFGFLIAAAACAPAAEQPAADEAASSASEPSLKGAWRITEFSTTSPDTSITNSAPQPSLFVFLDGHYSSMYVPGDEPRQLFAGDQVVVGTEEPTEAEKIAAFDSFIANSGTYEVTGSTLTTRPIVAKNPNFMAGGSLSYTYAFEGESVRLTAKLPWAPNVELGFVLTRLE